MEHIFYNLPLAVVHLDAETRILQLNEQAKLLLGWQDVPEIMPLFTEFLSEGEMGVFSSFYQNILKRGQPR